MYLALGTVIIIVAVFVTLFLEWRNMAFVFLECNDRCTVVSPRPRGEQTGMTVMRPGILKAKVEKRGKTFEYHLEVTRGENYFSFDPPALPIKKTGT